jgi:aminopeptidase N
MSQRYLFLLSILVVAFHSLKAQQAETVDFLKVTAQIEPISSERKVIGTASYTFNVLKNTDSIYLDAKAMKVMNIASESITISEEKDKIWLLNKFEANRQYTASFSFEATPRQTLYFVENQIWTQGQGKYTSHWLPSLDDMNDKIEFDLTIVAPSEKTVIANGQLVSNQLKDNKNYSQFDMQEPMASYLVAFAVGDFMKKTIYSNSDIPIELYYEAKDSLKIEPTYRHTKEIFDFLESEIGVAYPWQNYKQVPVRDFLYAGMENTTATFFSEAFISDSIGFTDRNYVNVNAHELAHQWFGNLVTETEGTHHWLHEGFATYFALLAEKEIFGEEYYYWKLFQTAEQLQALSDEGKGQSLLNAKASSLTFYEKGAWALHILRSQIGDDAFRIAIINYLEKFSFKNVTTENFLNEARAASVQDLKEFEADWLKQSAFKAEQAYKSLMESPFIKKYFEVAALGQLSLVEKRLQLKIALTFPNDYIGQEAVYQLAGEPISETIALYKNGFASNNIYVRQAIALSLESIPEELKEEYESLFNDASYITQEAALYNLWSQFPENRAIYLNKMRGVIGFQNRNVRQLWLVLALVDPTYRIAEKEKFKKELKSYTAPAYSFEIRETAFGYINELQFWDESVLANLVNACAHPSWRFKKYARKLLASVMKNETYKTQIILGMETYSDEEKAYLKTKLISE